MLKRRFTLKEAGAQEEASAQRSTLKKRSALKRRSTLKIGYHPVEELRHRSTDDVNEDIIKGNKAAVCSVGRPQEGGTNQPCHTQEVVIRRTSELGMSRFVQEIVKCQF